MLPKGYEQGRLRPYAVSDVPKDVLQRARLTLVDHFYVFALFSAAILVRLYKLPSPSAVVFDEVHSGDFVNEYYHQRFFLDVHPPLAKLMYYALAVLFGYDGTFDFDAIGDHYTATVPFVAMRLMSGIMGVLTVPLTYLVLRNTYCGSVAAGFGAVLVMLENSLITQSRFMFLDSPLMFFMVLSMYFYSVFCNTRAFSGGWYASLAMTGVALGCVCSVKLSGLFTYVWFGILTVMQLWTLLGDQKVSDLVWIKHLVVRAVCLVVVPVTVYLSVFAVHFNIVKFEGQGAGPMTPRFKSTLQGFDKITNQPVEVVYGSTITLKHKEMGGYLHSHKFNYKGGSKEQQVTLYSFHTDYNNQWEIHPKNKRTESQLKEQIKPIKNGDIVRLFHKSTGKYLHVTDNRPPLTEKDYANEVSCDGDKDLLGDINYEFKVKILDKAEHSQTDLPLIKLRATESVFQLFHQGTRCSLVSHLGKLPKWAFGQNEVLCINEPTIPNTLWYIETNSHPMLNNDDSHARVDYGHYLFLQKFIEYHQVVFRYNSQMTDAHDYSSRPETWPFLLRGVNYYSAAGQHIYFLGNMAIYYFGIAAVVFIGLKQVGNVVTYLNPFSVPNETQNVKAFYSNTMACLMGFFVHYYPYFLFDRQLFLHHYLPALYMLIMMVVYFVEYQLSKRKLGYVVMVMILGAAAMCWYTMVPITYGIGWSRLECVGARWYSSWDIDCSVY